MKKTKWTPETLCAAMETYIFKSKFTKKDQSKLLEMSKSMGEFDPLKVISKFIDNFDIFGPAENLLSDLEILCDFPNNSEFLGMKDEMNYRTEPNILTDTNGKTFISKTDVFLKVYQFITEKHFTDEVSKLILQSYGNKIYRKLKNSYELIPAEIADNVIDFIESAFKNRSDTDKKESFKLSSFSVNEVGSILMKLYDNQYDQKLLEHLRDLLIALNKKKPIRSNKQVYEEICSQHYYIVNTIKSVLNEFPYVFQQYNSKIKNFPHYPVIRIFKFNTIDNEEAKFVIGSDLNFALQNEKEKVLETSTQLKNGILLTVSIEKMEDILKTVGMTIDDLHIIEMQINTTSRETAVPIIASNGSHYKLASSVFNEVMEVFTTELRWFESVHLKHCCKLYRWFDCLSHLFDSNIRVKYLLKIKTVVELKEKAHEDLGKFAKKPVYDVSKNANFDSLEQVREEVMKMSNGAFDEVVWRALVNKQTKKFIKPTYSKSDVLFSYHEYTRTYATKEMLKMRKFFSIQMDMLEIVQAFEVLSYINAMRNNNENNTDSLTFLKMINLFLDPLDHMKGLVISASLVKVGDDEDDFMKTVEMFDNETFFKKTLDLSLFNWDDYATVFSLIYEAELSKTKLERLFYLQKNEFMVFRATHKRRFDEMMENYLKEESKGNEHSYFWKNEFRGKEYSEEFDKSMIELNEKMKRPGILLKMCVEVRKFYYEVFECMGSLRKFYEHSQTKTILIRIMCEMKNDEQKEWHMFSEDVLEAIEIVLEEQNRLDLMKDRIEKWRQSWKTTGTFSIISIPLFETVLDVVGIAKSKFLLVPDMEYFRNSIELPVRMGYHAMKILSPCRTPVYHQYQAQYLIFQYGACDINWHKDWSILKEAQKNAIICEILKIGKGYTLAENVEKTAESMKYNLLAQKTPLSVFCGKSYDEKLTMKNLTQMYRSWTDETAHPSMDAHVHKNVTMFHWIRAFFNTNDDLKTNVIKASTIHCAHDKIANLQQFNSWNNDPVNFTVFDADSMNLCFMRAHNFNKFTTEFNENPFLEKHYLFDDDDCFGMLASEKMAKMKVDGTKKDDVLNNKLEELLKNMLPEISDEVFEPVEKFWQLFGNVLLEEFDEEQATNLIETLPTHDEASSVKKMISEHLEFITVNEMALYRKKKVEIVEPVKKTKPKQEKDEEKPKIVTKYVTETRIVESCEKCREIDKETMKFNRKFEEYEKEIEKNRRIIGQNEEDLITLKNQVTQNKHKYREEIQKQKEIIENRDGKIEQLHDELKQYREDLKIEREKLYEEVRESSEMSKENVRKMKTEVENMKFSEKNKSNFIEKLEAEIEQLKSSLEIEQENHLTTKWELEMSQAKVKSLEEQLPQTFDISSSIPEMVNLKTSNIEIVDQVLPESSELKKSEPSYVCLICITDIETGQNSTKCVKCCRKYHAECATSWLRMNSVCPVCKTFLRDPTDYPTL